MRTIQTLLAVFAALVPAAALPAQAPVCVDLPQQPLRSEAELAAFVDAVGAGVQGQLAPEFAGLMVRPVGSDRAVRWIGPDRMVQTRCGDASLARDLATVPVAITSGPRLLRIGVLRFKLSVPARVCVARVSIARDAVVDASDCTFETLPVALGVEGPDFSQGSGPRWRARRTIHAGEVVAGALVFAETPVRRGEPVVVEAGSASIRVETRALALRDALLGEQVPVRDLTTHQVLVGEVTEPGRVRIR